jgi:hypothetical protein
MSLKKIKIFEKMKIEDNRLFSVVPRNGHLEPDESVRVTFTYKHRFNGTNKIPVLFKISKGREIMVEHKRNSILIEIFFGFFLA